jgi:hypothetical protein
MIKTTKNSPRRLIIRLRVLTTAARSDTKRRSGQLA